MNYFSVYTLLVSQNWTEISTPSNDSAHQVNSWLIITSGPPRPPRSTMERKDVIIAACAESLTPDPSTHTGCIYNI